MCVVDIQQVKHTLNLFQMYVLQAPLQTVNDCTENFAAWYSFRC